MKLWTISEPLISDRTRSHQRLFMAHSGARPLAHRSTYRRAEAPAGRSYQDRSGCN